MSRSKRKTDHKAFRQGYNQGVRGHGSRLCPYKQDDDKKGMWLGGWRQGHQDYQSGYRHDPDDYL